VLLTLSDPRNGVLNETEPHRHASHTHTIDPRVAIRLRGRLCGQILGTPFSFIFNRHQLKSAWHTFQFVTDDNLILNHNHPFLS